jgi:GNAT superfamily N-acetyltransferase
MKVQSLGHRTDLIFPRFDGKIIDRGDYLVILTPSNPTYHWGNYLLFSRPPGQNDLSTWKTIFDEEIGARLKAEHYAFGWDTVAGEQGEVQPFLAEGFNLTETVVLTTAQVQPPPKVNHDASIRPIATDNEWEQATRNQITCRPPGFGLAGYEVFKRAQMARYRRMTEAGLGAWFGAFLEERLVADLGVFTRGDLGRFQQVETHPDFRRRGICGTLVYRASRYALEQWAVNTLVMLADENYHAARIYESVGFQPREHLAQLDWWDESTA